MIEECVQLTGTQKEPHMENISSDSSSKTDFGREKSDPQPQQTNSVQLQELDREVEHPEPRRSERERSKPSRLNYTELGNPLMLVMHSLLDGIEKAFAESLAYPVTNNNLQGHC